MSKEEADYSSSEESKSDSETKDKSQALVNYSKKSIFLYDKKCRTVLHLGVIYRNLSKAATNAIDLDKITNKIQSMINKNQIYLRDVGPIILGITKIIVKKTFFLYKDIEELTNLRIGSYSRDPSKIQGNISEDNSEIKERKSKDLIINGKKLLGNDKEERTSVININSLDTEGLNFQNTAVNGLNSTVGKNKIRAGNKFNEMTFSKDIIELSNDDMIRRTIQKMSKLDNTDIKDIFETNKKKTKEDIKYETENKNSKTINNLKEMLLNKGKNNNLNSSNLNDLNMDYSAQNSVINDANNKDVENFFTVVKSQIANDNNAENNNDNNETNFDFDFNMDNFKDDNYLFSNKKFKINKEEMKNNLKYKITKKTEFMRGNAKLKYDDELELENYINFDKLKKGKLEEIEKKLEEENDIKLGNIQFNNNIFLFDKSKLTGFINEKYEYLLPQYLEAKEDFNEESSSKKDLESYTKMRNDSNFNTDSKLTEKNDISRAERFTTSNKKKISLGNFDSSNILMNNLSKLTLDRNDFKGAQSFIEKMNLMDNKENNNNENTKEEFNINNDMDLIEPENDNEENISKDAFEENNNKIKEAKTNEELKEEEDAKLLKQDLENNVFSKNKKKITFDKIRDKLENKEKFEEPKLFYDLLLLAQNGDIEITQKDLMVNKTINVSLNY